MINPDIQDTSDDLKGDVPFLGKVRVLLRQGNVEQWGEVNFRIRGLYIKLNDGTTLPFDIQKIHKAEINGVMFDRVG